MADFRLTPGTIVDWHDTTPPFSNFEFVDTRFASNAILRRILSIARKLGYRGMLEEEIVENDCPLLGLENEALRRRLPDFQRSQVIRLSFFSQPARAQPGDFFGYAVIKIDSHAGGRFTHVYEAIIVPPRAKGQNNFCHAHRDYEVHTALGRFSVRGTIYAQQNDATSVCAHVALRTMLSCLLPAGDISYAELNRLAGVDHVDPARQLGTRGRPQNNPGQGLTSDQIERILQQVGLAPELVVHEPGGLELPVDAEFQRLLYGYLESGRPLLLGFELGSDPVNHGDGRHIIPVFGHTFNEDLWAPEAERKYFGHDRGFFPSESWLSSYVAHDDNIGPYVCLPRHYLTRSQFRLLVGVKPFPSTITAGDAEAAAFEFANYLASQIPLTGLKWLDRQMAFTRAQLLVLRPMLTSRQNYITQLRTWRDRDGFDLEPALGDQLERELPTIFWLVELSAPELFPGSRRKFGEILIQADPPPATPAVALFMRAPSLLVLRGAAGFTTHRTRLAGHTDLFRLS